MQGQIYKDPIIAKYVSLITAKVPAFFKMVYQGDPLRIPKSNMPALIVSKSTTRVGVHTNAEDEHEVKMIVTVVSDMRDEINDDQQTVPGIAQLYDIIEGRNEDYTLKPESILNILRTNIEVDVSKNLRTDLGTITEVDYGITVGKRQESSFATEAQIEFIATFTQLRQ